MIRAVILVAALLTAATPLGAAMPEMANGYGSIDAKRDVDPLTLASRFCQARITGDMSPLAQHFAPKLAHLVERRDAASIPWQTFPDRPSDCSLTVVNGVDDTIGVLVRITYDTGARRWSDVLNLERTPDSWWINNVFYETGGNLRFRLVQPE
jgi:hypothetical protein